MLKKISRFARQKKNSNSCVDPPSSQMVVPLWFKRNKEYEILGKPDKF
jgi:hypothetical protein